MRILNLCTYDQGGGAEKVAFDLFRSYREYGHDARLLVRYKRTKEENVSEVDPYRQTAPWAPGGSALERRIRRTPRFPGQYRLVEWLRRAAWPQRWMDHWRGVEDFSYPYSWQLLDGSDWRPDVIHAHNLHGNYFDLRAVSLLSQEVPVVWTLHDTWAMTGHCAYFIDCPAWRTGCGPCPDLVRPPAIRRDRTRENWERKRQIYAGSRLAVTTPSRWLMDCVEQSTLRPWQTKVIPNGLDLKVFLPGGRRQARSILGLPQDSFICMYIAQGGSSNNPYKDFVTVDRAIREVMEQKQSADLLFVCVGGGSRAASDVTIHFTGYLADPHRVSLHYQASDVLLHAANAENFPCVILEAFACGTPVVATAVGGIPEQITDGETGFLVPRGDSTMMAQRVLDLMNRPTICQHMGHAAAVHARRTFGLGRQAEAFLQWFDELREEYSRKAA